MRPLLPILLSTAAPLLAQVLAQPGATPEPYVEVDCQKLERRIGKEPAYVAEPRYALFVLDLAGRNRTWAVTDKSTRDAPFHDVLYLDLDADGDLTGPGERFVGQRDPNKAPAGLEMSFRIPELRVPGTALVHKSFLLSTSPKKDRSGFWFRMQWNGRHEVSGGYDATGIDTTAWATSAAKAPVLRPCPLGPLRVPAGAVAGPAKLRIELKSATGKVGVPTEIDAVVR